jgi:hypothetical protein
MVPCIILAISTSFQLDVHTIHPYGSISTEKKYLYKMFIFYAKGIYLLSAVSRSFSTKNQTLQQAGHIVSGGGRIG